MVASLGTRTCGFCLTGYHSKCVGAIRSEKDPVHLLWICSCSNSDCGEAKFRCLNCSDTEGEIDSHTWLCVDTATCKARVTERLESDPDYQRILRIQERAKMNENVEKKVRAKAAPKVGKCILTGRETKGGKFAPGMDARYVSVKVKETMAGNTTEADVLQEMDGHGLSDAMKAKYNKGLGIAREKADKAKADKAEAKARAAAKAE